MKTAIEIISKTPLFSGLDEDALQKVCAITVRKDYDKGQIIFSEGDAGNGFYTIVSGRVKIFKVAPEGKEQILHIFGPGEPFGEVPVFTGRPFPATAQAIAGTSLLFFPKGRFCGIDSSKPLSGPEHAGRLVHAASGVYGSDRESLAEGSARAPVVLFAVLVR